MPELLQIPGGIVAIEQEMRVVPRCGSCFEPLFTSSRWLERVRIADDMVDKGYKRDAVLMSVIEQISVVIQHHICRDNIIEEEP